MKKYEVTFTQHNGDKKSFVVIAENLKFEDAIQFALNLHRSSNCEHVIGVYLINSSLDAVAPEVEFYSEK